MATKLSLEQLEAHLKQQLEHAVATGDPCVVQRNGQDYVVIVSASQWRRLEMGQRLDMLGPSYRLTKQKQRRVEELLAQSKQRRLKPAERDELNALLRECDAVMQRRLDGMDLLR
jgi:prevent-host-death family protein